MIDSANRSLQRFLADLRAMRNIDAYIVAGAAIVFAVLTAFGDRVSDELKMAALLAGVGLLIYNITIPETQAHARLDDFLNDRSDFVPLRERIEKAHTLWIYAPSAANILDPQHTRAIQQTILSHANGELRVIIQDPDKEAEISNLKSQLDDRISYQVQDLSTEIQRTIDSMRKMKTWNVAGTFDYRFLPHNPGFSLVVIDPDTRRGVVIVEFYGYTHDHTASRMHIEITPDQSERWFTYWAGQFSEMWEDAREDGAA